MTKLNDTIATGNRGWQAGPGQLMPNSHIECVDGYRTHWAYFWTSVANYLEHREGWIPAHGGRPKLSIQLDAAADSGTWDERIASTGCRKIGLREIAGLLRPLGVDVTVLEAAA